MNEKNNNEEVDLTSLIKEFKSFTASISKSIGDTFRAIGKAIGFLFSKLKFISIVALIGGLIGIIVHFSEETKYQSSLLVKMNVDAREQLANDINYFNSLINDKEITELGQLLSITKDEAKTVKLIEVTPYIPEFEKLKNYNSIYSSLDSNVRDLIGLNIDMINTAGNLSYITNKFNIVITSTNPRIFSKVEGSLINYISKSEELNKKLKVGLDELAFRKQTLIKQINDLDTLQRVLNNVLIEESKIRDTQAQTTIQLNQSEKNSEFDILEVHKRNRDLADQLADIDTKISKLDNVYTIESHFSEYGQVSSLTLTVKILIGISLGVVFSILFLIIKLTPKQI